MFKQFPFSAILGQDDFKLCLILNVIDPTIGGVLATGDKGTGKTTTVRALSQLMGADFPFVNLPIGATEDRVLGNVNLETLINEKKTVIDKGLLAKAHGGFLYIDEVNLLNDYLMDVLLDASASGGYHLEREGISAWQDSRFCLVGTMNPEEGSLRPQLTDRFGLSVTITTPKDIQVRKQIAIQRLEFDSDNDAFYKRYIDESAALKSCIIKAKQQLTGIVIPESIQELSSQLTLDNNVEGMRADILLLKTVRAYAAYLGETIITEDMLHKIAPFVLQHRSKDYSPPSQQNPQNNEQETPNNSEEQTTQPTSTTSSFQLPEVVKKGLKFNTNKAQKKQEVKLSKVDALKTVRYPNTREKKIALLDTVKHYITHEKFSAKYHFKTDKSIARIVFLVDTSASMAIDKQLGYLKGIIQKTIEANPLKKVHYAIVGLEKASARIIQDFTTNTGLISEVSHQLVAKGKTNLGAAFFRVYELLRSINKKTVQLFVFTDGKANAGNENPFNFAIYSYKTYLSAIPNTTIIDTENSFVKLGKAQQLAQQLRLQYVSVSSLNQ